MLIEPYATFHSILHVQPQLLTNHSMIMTLHVTRANNNFHLGRARINGFPAKTYSSLIGLLFSR